MKFAKVIFSQLVCVQRGLCPGGLCLGGLCPRGSLSRGGLCEQISIRQTPPVRLRVGGMHPTGMHSCFLLCVVECCIAI